MWAEVEASPRVRDRRCIWTSWLYGVQNFPTKGKRAYFCFCRSRSLGCQGLFHHDGIVPNPNSLRKNIVASLRPAFTETRGRDALHVQFSRGHKSLNPLAHADQSPLHCPKCSLFAQGNHEVRAAASVHVEPHVYLLPVDGSLLCKQWTALIADLPMTSSDESRQVGCLQAGFGAEGLLPWSIPGCTRCLPRSTFRVPVTFLPLHAWSWR